jgi:hypothetical protein
MPRRHTTAAVAAVACVLLAAPFLTGCGTVNKVVGCVHTADAIANTVTDLQQDVEQASGDRKKTDEDLDDIDKKLKKIKDTTDDSGVKKTVGDVQQAADNVRTSVDKGDKTPDLSPLTDAAGQLTKVCSP